MMAVIIIQVRFPQVIKVVVDIENLNLDRYIKNNRQNWRPVFSPSEQKIA